MFRVFEIIAFEHISGISLIYDKNTCEGQSTCYQAVLRLHIWVKEMFSNSTCLTLMEIQDESAAVLVCAVIVTREHVDSPKVF